MKNFGTLLYTISLVLATICGVLATNASLWAIVVCSAGVIITIIALMVRNSQREQKDAFKNYLFDYFDLYEQFFNKSYDELTDILLKKGGINFDFSDPNDKPVELALINRLAYLKFLEKSHSVDL